MIIYIEFWFQEYILGIWGIAQSVLFKGKIPSLGFCLFIFFTLRKVSYWEADFIPLDLLPSIISPLTVMTGLQIEICIIWHSPFSFSVDLKTALWSWNMKHYCYFLVQLFPQNVNGWKCYNLLWKQKHLYNCFTILWK